jgi:phosphohistidine phosphatase
MDLVVVRHAVAMSRAEFGPTGEPDDVRPLTRDGRREMTRAAKGLRALVPWLDVLASSPLVRARDTAGIIAAAYEGLAVVEIDALRPGSPFEEALAWLRRQPAGAVVAVVGHEPHLGGLVSWLLAELDVPVVSFKKGAACLVRFDERAAAGGGMLRWMLAPSHLKAVGS